MCVLFRALNECTRYILDVANILEENRGDDILRLYIQLGKGGFLTDVDCDK